MNLEQAVIRRSLYDESYSTGSSSSSKLMISTSSFVISMISSSVRSYFSFFIPNTSVNQNKLWQPATKGRAP